MCMSILVWAFAACSRYLKNEFHADAKWPMILELKHRSYYKRRIEAEWKPASLGDFLVERDDMLEWVLSLILGEMSSTEIGKKFVYWSSTMHERCLISRRMIWKSWKQFGVKNIATTGHQLQGMSKDQLIVSSWNYSSKNWIYYVVLSRVRTLSGL